MLNKSPFIIIDDFISPLLCEEIVNNVPYQIAKPTSQGTLPISSTHDETYQPIIFDKIQPLIPKLETYFNFKYKGMEKVNFEWVAQTSSIDAHSENSDLIEQRWVKTRERDFCCILFLSDFNEQAPFDSNFECYGGNLEFINHCFNIRPSRGSLIVFPSDPRFSNATAPVQIGDLYQIRVHIAASETFIYHPKQFPGDYTCWF